MKTSNLGIYCNCEVKLLKLKANYNFGDNMQIASDIVIAR